MNLRMTLAAAALTGMAPVHAEPVTYDIDPSHTFPSFAADHLGGLSVWRGKFNDTSGTIVLDRAAKTGTLNISVKIDSVDFGHDEMNKHAVAPDIFDAAKYPEATFKGTFTQFDGDRPTRASGDFTLRGVTRPLELEIGQFKCMVHPMEKRDVCGADASAAFNRGDFGLDFGLDMGFKPEVTLQIQVEAFRQ